MNKRAVFASLVLILALAPFNLGLSCEAWDFDEEITLVGGLGKVNGLGLKYHPYNPEANAIDEETYVAWRLGNLEESDSSTNMPVKCDLEDQYPSQAGAQVWRTLEIGDLDCTYSRGSRELGPGVTQTYIAVNATWSTYPDFLAIMEVSAVSSNFTVNNGEGNRTDGLVYEIHHRPDRLKTSLQIENWPWGGPNGTSFLVASFLGAIESHDHTGNLSTLVGQEESFMWMNTSRYEMRMENAHFLMIDDEPVLKTFASYLYRSRGPFSGETPAGFFFPFSVCRDNEPGILPHWNKIVYDPQFSSLFVGAGVDSPEQSPLVSPTEKRNRKTAAIATGVTFGIVGVILAAAAVYIIFFYKPMAARGGSTLESARNSSNHKTSSV